MFNRLTIRMNKFVLKLLMTAALALGFMGMIPSNMSGAVPQRSGSSIRIELNEPIVAKAPSKSISKRKLARRKRAITLLREYLPQYADILETEGITLKEAFFTGDLLVPLPYDFDSRSPFIFPHLRVQLLQNIDDWLGTGYRFGGWSRRGIDCSAFTSTIMAGTLNKKFRGTSRWQARQFTPIFDSDSLQFGDMIFFTGTNRFSKRIGHVGIYLGNGVFAHSSSSRGVTYSHITDGYYTKRFRWGGRFILEPIAEASTNGR